MAMEIRADAVAATETKQHDHVLQLLHQHHHHLNFESSTSNTTSSVRPPLATTTAVDYSTIKHHLAEAELHQQQSLVHLTTATSILQAAQSQHDMAKSVYDESVAKVENLKLRYRQQIMEEQLQQPCRWNVMYRKLIEWKESHDGDTTVPCDTKCSSSEIIKLNRWVVNQRTSYKYFMNGDTKHIKDYRVDALNKIGFVWSVPDQLWESNFEELRRYHAEFGHFNITQKQNRKLAQFVSRLRTAMSHKRQGLVQQELTDDRIQRLDSINFIWDIKGRSTSNETVKFDIMYNHLVSFKETYGHTKVNKLEKEWKKGISVPTKKVYRRLPLFLAFLRKEQLMFAAGHPCSLDEEKIRLITELGVEWRKSLSEPRKSTGGEGSRGKKSRTVESDDQQLIDQVQHAQQRQQQQQQQSEVHTFSDEYHYHNEEAIEEIGDHQVIGLLEEHPPPSGIDPISL